MMRLIYRLVVKWVSGLKWDDFERVIDWVTAAARQWPRSAGQDDAQRQQTNAKRVEWVDNLIRHAFPQLESSWVVNVLRELAVAWIRKA